MRVSDRSQHARRLFTFNMALTSEHGQANLFLTASVYRTLMMSITTCGGDMSLRFMAFIYMID